MLDRKWAKFLKDNSFLVGLSIDGPAHVHDHYRRLSGGAPSFRSIRDRALLLLDAGVDVNAVAVINDYSVQFPEEIYQSLKEIGFAHLQFITCVETDSDDSSRAAAFSAPPEEYGRFLCRLFDLWMSGFNGGLPTTYIRFFESVFFIYAGQTPPDCTLQETCGTYLAIEHNGDVFPCDFFIERGFRLGNVRSGRLVHMINSDMQRRFGHRKSVLPGPCRDCRWRNFCRGGCPKNRLRDPRDGGLDHFCASYRLFFQYAHERFISLANDWQHRHLKSRAIFKADNKL